MKKSTFRSSFRSTFRSSFRSSFRFTDRSTLIPALVVVTMLGVVACATPETGKAQNTGAASSSVSSGPSESGEVTTSDKTPVTGAGNYPTTPIDVPATAGTEEAGRLAEGARLAEYVLVPTFVLPDYVIDDSTATYIIQDASHLSELLNEPAPERAAEHDMITGFSSSRQTKPDTSGAQNVIINAVLTFPSPENATAAATDLNDAVGGAETITIPGVDGVEAKVDIIDNSPSAYAFVAHNSLVHYVLVTIEDATNDELAEAMSAMLTAQIDASDNFEPTLLDRVSRLPADREGMLAHTLPSDASEITTLNRVFGIRGMKHFFINPLDDETAITDAGVDLVSRGLTGVYRAQDEAGAKLLQAEYWRQYDDYYLGSPEFTGPSEVPGIQCIGEDGDFIACVFSRGRYTVELGSTTAKDISEQAIAQYALLDGF